MPHLEDHIIYFSCLLKQVGRHISVDGDELAEGSARPDVGCEIVFDVVLDLTVSLVKVIDVEDQGTLVWIGFYGQMASGVVLREQVYGRKVQADGDEEGREQKVGKETITGSRYYQVALLNKGHELTPKAPVVLVSD